MSDSIQVREGWWRQRGGDVVHVKRDKDSPVRIRAYYPWCCKVHNYSNGGLVDAKKEYSEDLVEFLGEEIEIRRVR